MGNSVCIEMGKNLLKIVEGSFDKKLNIDKVNPLNIATLDSFQRTLNISLNSTSCNDNPRIIVADD